MFLCHFAHQEVRGITLDQNGAFNGIGRDANGLLCELAMANVAACEDAKPRRHHAYITPELLLDEDDAYAGIDFKRSDGEYETSVPSTEPDQYERMALMYGGDDWGLDGHLEPLTMVVIAELVKDWRREDRDGELEEHAEAYRPKIRHVVEENPGVVSVLCQRERSRGRHRAENVSWKFAARRTGQFRSASNQRRLDKLDIAEDC